MFVLLSAKCWWLDDSSVWLCLPPCRPHVSAVICVLVDRSSAVHDPTLRHAVAVVLVRHLPFNCLTHKTRHQFSDQLVHIAGLTGLHVPIDLSLSMSSCYMQSLKCKFGGPGILCGLRAPISLFYILGVLWPRSCNRPPIWLPMPLNFITAPRQCTIKKEDDYFNGDNG